MKKRKFRMRAYVDPKKAPDIARELANLKFGFSVNFGTPHAEFTIYQEGSDYMTERAAWVEFFEAMATPGANIFFTDVTENQT